MVRGAGAYRRGRCAASTPAEAAFSICNKTTHAASVALGFYDGKDWGSSGWWTVVPGACERIVTEPLVARYYLYATHQDIGGAWEGDRSFCGRSGTLQRPGAQRLHGQRI
jgi:uncharacterized membrane protein